jgi:hypothetical protein
MLSRLGEAMPRVSGASVGGAGLRERLRSTTFALLGAVTAVGLVLVGIAYNQGWPEFVNSPIPSLRSEGVADARVAADAVGPAAPANNPSSAAAPAPGQGGHPSENGRKPGSDGTAQQTSAAAPENQVQVSAPSGQGGLDVPPPSTGPPPTAPAAADPPATVGAPPAPSPAQTPAPSPPPSPATTSPPVAPPAGVASGPGKGKAKGHEKNGGPAQPASSPPPAPAPVTSPPPQQVPTEPPSSTVGGNPGKGGGNAYGHSK